MTNWGGQDRTGVIPDLANYHSPLQHRVIRGIPWRNFEALCQKRKGERNTWGDHPIRARLTRRLYYVDWDEEFGRRRQSRPRPLCSICIQKDSMGRCRFGTHFCGKCEETYLEFIRITHRNELSWKKRPTSSQEE